MENTPRPPSRRPCGVKHVLGAGPTGSRPGGPLGAVSCLGNPPFRLVPRRSRLWPVHGQAGPIHRRLQWQPLGHRGSALSPRSFGKEGKPPRVRANGFTECVRTGRRLRRALGGRAPIGGYASTVDLPAFAAIIGCSEAGKWNGRNGPIRSRPLLGVPRGPACLVGRAVCAWSRVK